MIDRTAGNPFPSSVFGEGEGNHSSKEGKIQAFLFGWNT